jgi:hypothetical protein
LGSKTNLKTYNHEKINLNGSDGLSLNGEQLQKEQQDR